MKRIALLSSIAALCVALTAGHAVAQEGTMPDWANKNGAFGVGGNTTLGGLNGINIRTYVSPLFGLHFTLGFNMDSVDPGEGVDTQTTTTFNASVYGSYKLAYWQRGHLSVIFGVDIRNMSPPGDADSQTFVLAGLGLMGEWFPTQYLSLFIQAGLTLDFKTSDVEDGFGINLGSQLLGQAGFTVWFQ